MPNRAELNQNKDRVLELFDKLDEAEARGMLDKYPIVATHDELPTAADHSGETWQVVRDASRGDATVFYSLYTSDGASWSFEDGISTDPGGANIFLMNVQPVGEGTVTPVTAPGGAITQFTTTTNQLRVTGESDGGKAYRGEFTVAGTAVEENEYTRITGDRRYRFTTDVDVSGKSELVITGNGGLSAIPITRIDAPVVETLDFAGDYPLTTFDGTSTRQTELKEGDQMTLEGTTDVPISEVQVQGKGALKAESISVSGTSFSVTVTIRNTGVTTQAKSGFIRVIDASSGAQSLEAETASTVACNNSAPVLNSHSLTFPDGQTALKESEFSYITPELQSTDVFTVSSSAFDITRFGGTDQVQAVLNDTGRAAGYQVSGTNVTFELYREANGATETSSLLIPIAHDLPALTISVPDTRLRSGGSYGSTAPVHTVTVASDQELQAGFSLTASSGTWQNEWTQSQDGTTFTRGLEITDGAPKGSQTFTGLAATNRAGRPVTDAEVASGSSYTVGGFVARTFSVPALQREVAIGTTVTDPSKLVCTNSALGGEDNYTYAVGSTADTPGSKSYTISDGAGSFDADGGHWYNLDPKNVNQNTTGTQQITLEEAV